MLDKPLNTETLTGCGGSAPQLSPYSSAFSILLSFLHTPQLSMPRNRICTMLAIQLEMHCFVCTIMKQTNSEKSLTKIQNLVRLSRRGPPVKLSNIGM